jgi:hypothetical protein
MSHPLYRPRSWRMRAELMANVDTDLESLVFNRVKSAVLVEDRSVRGAD